MKSRRVPRVILALAVFVFFCGFTQIDKDDAACYCALSGFERPLTQVIPPPHPSSFKDVQLLYAQSGCLGNCPSFTVTLKESEALFDGHAFVRAKGKHKARLNQKELEAVVNLWFESGFYAMRNDYCSASCPDGRESIVLDEQETYIKLSTPEFLKQVHECYFTVNGEPARPRPPDSYFELKRQLDEFVKAKGWL